MNLFRALGLAVILSAAASAASAYKVELTSATSVGGTQLQPGQYKVEVTGDKAVFTSGKKVVAETPVTVETGAKKYSDTQVSTINSTMQSIAVGGTTMKIVLKAK
ncbi:MAG: hypothetical protein ABI811_22610 [Acidobacteriota bacterium]